MLKVESGRLAIFNKEMGNTERAAKVMSSDVTRKPRCDVSEGEVKHRTDLLCDLRAALRWDPEAENDLLPSEFARR